MPNRTELTTAFGLLSNERRFALIDALADRGSLELGTFANELVDDEIDAPRDTPEWKNKRKAAYISLIQNHVPKLVDAGVVQYDEDAHIVMRGDRFDDVAEVLDSAKSSGSPLARVGQLFA